MYYTIMHIKLYSFNQLLDSHSIKWYKHLNCVLPNMILENIWVNIRKNIWSYVHKEIYCTSGKFVCKNLTVFLEKYVEGNATIILAVFWIPKWCIWNQDKETKLYKNH